MNWREFFLGRKLTPSDILPTDRTYHPARHLAAVRDLMASYPHIGYEACKKHLDPLIYALCPATVRASGFDPKTYDRNKKLTFPWDSDLPPEKLFETYLAGTKFIDFFNQQVPFAIPRKTYMEHGAIFAKSGHGKTQTLRAI